MNDSDTPLYVREVMIRRCILGYTLAFLLVHGNFLGKEEREFLDRDKAKLAGLSQEDVSCRKVSILNIQTVKCCKHLNFEALQGPLLA